MNPETAKTKITQLLDLGTLQGVKVEYEDGKIHNFLSTPLYPIWVENENKKHIAKYFAYEGAAGQDNIFRNIKSITPIPLQPKLLEDGTKVRVLLGMWGGRDAYILGNDGIGNYKIGFKADDTEVYIYVSIFHVVPAPESLLVEEECSHKNVHIEIVSPDTESRAEFIICNSCGNNINNEFLEKALNQAGYQVTKEI